MPHRPLVLGVCRVLLVLAAVSGLMAGGPICHAATVAWTNPHGGSFETAANWSTGTVPGSADSVVIGLPGTYAVTLTFPRTVTSLSMSGSGGVATLNLKGALTVTRTATVGANSVLALPALGGSFTAASCNVSGTVNWVFGTLKGMFALAHLAQLNISGTSIKTLSGVVNNGGTINWVGNSSIFGNTSGTASAFNNLVGATFNSRASGTGNNGLQAVQLNNAGTVNAVTGLLKLGTFFFPPSIGTNTGVLNLGTGAAIELSNGSYTMGLGARISGAGVLRDSGANVAVISPLTVQGTLELAPLGKIAGTGAVNVQSGGAFHWTGGALNGPGALNILAGGQLAISGSFGKTLNGTVNNSGIATLIGFPILGADQGHKGIINNLLGGQFSSPPATRYSLIGVDLNNSGTVNIGGSGKAGSIGMGTTFSQGTTGILNMDIGGRTSSTGFDLLDLVGTTSVARLGGTLNVHLINGFVPAATDLFKIMNYGSHTGAFAHLNTTGTGLIVAYSSTGVTLSRSGATGNDTALAAAVVSAIHASTTTDTVHIAYSSTLDPDTAGDPAHFTVQVNNVPVAVQSAAYNASSRSVTIGLEPGALVSGARVQVQWQGLVDGQGTGISDGCATVIAR